jgi:tellurite resistance protein TerC
VLIAWIALAVFVAVALAIDLRGATEREPTMRKALVWSLIWTVAGAAFALVVAGVKDGEAAGEYLTGFLIEKSLSLDNLFVFAVLFGFFAVPNHERRRVLIYGVAGAIVLRTLFIVAGAAALDAFHAFTYVLGAVLLLTAVKIARHGNDEMNPDKTLAMRAVKRFNLKPLQAAIVMVAAFDVMFAIDSIPAIFAITRDTFVVFAANAFSLLGMVSLYFLLDGLLDRFRYLNVGLAAILGYVAAKLLLVDVWHPPIGLSLAVIALSLLTAAYASVLAERREAGVTPGA